MASKRTMEISLDKEVFERLIKENWLSGVEIRFLEESQGRDYYEITYFSDKQLFWFGQSVGILNAFRKDLKVYH